MVARLSILTLVVALLLSAVFWIPRSPKIRESDVRMELPAQIGYWTGEEGVVTQKERDVLGKETTIVRKHYRSPFDDEIMVSIVLSGDDMVNSIHRPERCLPAQGWNVDQSTDGTIGANTKPLSTTCLHNSRIAQLENGEKVRLESINYYWFIGHGRQTGSHLQRNLMDIQDRVLGGYNQRWAYITVSGTVTSGLTRFGRTEEQTRKMLEEFIEQLRPFIEPAAKSK